MTMDVKQVILVRSDINMGPGKIASQVAHASSAYLTKRINVNYRGEGDIDGLWGSAIEYIKVTNRKKVVLVVHSESEMLELGLQAAQRGLEVNLIKDEGYTVFNGVLTTTALAIGPNFSCDIDDVTGHLELLA